MPDSACVTGEGFCPACGAPLLDYMRCQWGALPGSTYTLGEPVVWLRDATQAIIEPYTLVDVAPGIRRWNCGDPQFRNVILFDLDSYGGDRHLECAACRNSEATAVAIVRNGVFQQIRVLDDAEADRILGTSRGKANIVIVRDDESFWPREDWFDKTITYRPAPG